MSPTPPSTTSSSLHSPDGHQYRVVRKRNRVPVSCAPCRTRKLKCNRAVPCENCVKRGDGASCSYAQPKNRKKNTSSQNSPATPDDMQNRIDRLENLVLSLMTNGAQAAGPAAAVAAVNSSGSSDSQRNMNDLDIDDDDIDEKDESDTEQVTKAIGFMKVDTQSQKSYYVSEAHWASILNEISEVKSYFMDHKKQYEEQMQKIEDKKGDKAYAPSLIFGNMKKPSQAEIMSTFPSKYTTDMLMARYFNTYDPVTHILHAPTFWKEYARHWQDPSKTSLVWIGMVFAMLRLAMLSYFREGDEPLEFRGKCTDIAATYRNSMAQCLVLDDYTKPHRYVIEALILYLHGDYTQCKENEVSVWVLIGIIARLAMRMGYHRDSKMFSNVSAFQGEMRRRIWTFIRQADLLFSFQVGLPSMIRDGDSDADLPRNLYDDDFSEDSEQLPPERPVTDPTPVSCLIAKAQLTLKFGRVLEHVQKVKGSSYEEVMEIDNELRQAREVIPEHLQVRPVSECHNETASGILSRFGIMGIYHKAQCVLHRPFLTRARENPRYIHSRRSCIDSALELLRFQSMIHAESRPHGRFQNKKWYMGNLNVHDYLMAGTIIALDLYHGYRQRSSGRPPNDVYTWGIDREQELLTALRNSRDIWFEIKDDWAEAWKATMFLDLFIMQLNPGQQAKNTLADPNLTSSCTMAGPPPFDSQDEKQNAAITLGLLSSGLSPAGPTSPPQFGDAGMRLDALQPGIMDQLSMPTPGTFGMLGQMPDMQPFNLDWDAWDSYLQSSSLDPTNQAWPMLDFQSLPQQQQQPPPPLSQQQQPQTTAAQQQIPTTIPDATTESFNPQNLYDGGGSSMYSGANDPNIPQQRRMISIRHAVFRAITSSSARVIAKPRSLQIAAPSAALRLNNRVAIPTSAFQRRFFSEENRSGSSAFDEGRQEGGVDRSYTGANVRPEPQPNESVYVGNLFFDVSAEDLRREMEKYGTVENVRIVYDGRGLSKGFGYVKFDTQEAAQVAIDNMHLKIFEGRRVVVNYAHLRNPDTLRPRANAPSKTLFIGNMPFDMTDKDLNDLFKDVQNVIDVRVAMDRKTGAPRGFAHADFTDVASAEKAFETLSNKAPFGRHLKVDYSMGRTRPTFKSRQNNEGVFGGEPIAEQESAPEQSSEDAAPFTPGERPAGN
ncbi:hypothetical protein AJ80_01580 [Polytolypa hystricis UAMH7299]|uniref:Uncharacterized protein n=1 Tax=Polytolypa hystricis (strain UAMH7299) TaxID=1447883 RepID=A0A2B7YS09_POLH7|nr:hypothetical protein AJ80_01580 [Polytolypa hystricis UAMH7299]